MDWIWWNGERTDLEQDFFRPSGGAGGRWLRSAVNALNDDPAAIEADLEACGDARAGGAVVCWGGWATDTDTPPDPASGRFEQSPEVWLPDGRARIEMFFAGVAERAASAGVRVLVRPHAATGLSDLPGCVAFHRTFGDRLGLIAEPAALLTPETLEKQDELVARAGQVFAALESVAAVGVSNAAPAGDGLSPAPVHRGKAEVGPLLRALAPLIERGLPLLAVDADRDVQKAAVGESLRQDRIR